MPNVKPALRLDYIIGIDIYSFSFNLLSAVLIFFGLYLLIGRITDLPILKIATPLSVLWILAVLIGKRLYVTLDARKGKRYLDVLSKVNKVYGPGFHFVAWCYFPVENGEVDFQRHEPVEANMERQTAITFPSSDGYELFIDLLTMFRIVENEKDLARSLNYTIEEINKRVRARIASWLSELGGQNPYKTLLYYKAQIFTELALVFDGEAIRSEFELDLGIEILNPIGTRIDLTPDSRKTFQAQAKTDMVAASARRIQEELPSATADQCLLAALSAQELATRVVTTFDTPNLPPGLGTLVLGESAVAVGGGKKGGK